MPFLTIPHGRIFYADYPPSTPLPRATLLLHHGLGSTHAFYRPIIPILTSPPYNFRCITYDSISSGLSDIATEPQSIETLSEDVIAVLDALGAISRHAIDRPVLVGHSMAGILVAELAATHPGRFGGIVMLGPVLPQESLKERFEARITVVERAGMEVMADTVPTAATGSNSTPLQHAFIRSLLLSQNPKGYCSMCRVVAEAKAPDYAAIDLQTLFIAGSEDKSAPLEDCMKICDSIEACRMEVLEGMGHWHCVEAPEAVGKLIGEFVDAMQKGAV